MLNFGQHIYICLWPVSYTHLLTVLDAVYPFNDFNPEQTPLGEVYANKKIISEKNLSVDVYKRQVQT